MDDAKKNTILSHIDKIEQFARQPGNEWMLAELQQRFGVGGRLDDIYEYCIEKIIKEQAIGFYQQFPLKPIVPQLVRDFAMMEHFRRKNCFDEFSMAVYQQIECIANAICRNSRFDTVVNRLLGHPAYVSSTQNKDGSWMPITISSRKGTYQVAQLLFSKDNAADKSKSSAQAFSAIDKVYLVLYFICYEGKLQSSMYDTFISEKSTLNDICQIRNRNHRGSVSKDWQQVIYDRVDAQRGLYYVKFIQCLCSFVEKVTTGLSAFDELYSYALGQMPIAVKPSPKVLGQVDLNNIPKR